MKKTFLDMRQWDNALYEKGSKLGKYAEVMEEFANK